MLDRFAVLSYSIFFFQTCVLTMNSFLPELLNYCLGKRGIAKKDVMESGSNELLKRMRVKISRVWSGWYTRCIPNKVAYLLATAETGG